MAANDVGINVRLDLMSNDTPECPHGPTLLFEKCSQGSVRQFYACSACRDRKDCTFFQWVDEKVSKASKQHRKERNQQKQPQVSANDCWQRNAEFRVLEVRDRNYCSTCDVLLVAGKCKEGHVLTKKITDDQLSAPSLLLTPQEKNKKNAQYLFSQKTVDFMISAIEGQGFDHVVSVGTPRIHEQLMQQQKNSKGILLDIDHRYAQFYSPEQFLRYNMFNHHFFEGNTSYGSYSKFLSDASPGKLVLVIDPPFGGRVDILAHVYQKVCKEYHRAHPGTTADIPFMFIFPYFMEPRVLECMPFGTHMLDYKVDYDNHATFKDTGRKYGSPARIFTNISVDEIVLPKAEGYRMCKPCGKYVSVENVHCVTCGICPSKDGSTYKHCDPCNRCVKPSREHCDTCKQCLPKDHVCGEGKKGGCFLCGDMGHKQRECPKRKEIVQEGKRKKKMDNSQKKFQKKSKLQ